MMPIAVAMSGSLQERLFSARGVKLARKSGEFRIGSRSLAQPDALGPLVSPKAFRVGIPLGGMARR